MFMWDGAWFCLILYSAGELVLVLLRDGGDRKGREGKWKGRRGKRWLMVGRGFDDDGDGDGEEKGSGGGGNDSEQVALSFAFSLISSPPAF